MEYRPEPAATSHPAWVGHCLAIRHDIAPWATGRVEVSARPEREPLARTIGDDGVERCSGFPLRDVRARLLQLYPGDPRFEVVAAHGGGVTVSLQIPLAFEEPLYVGA